MPRITQVEKQQKNPHRYNIYIDGVFGFGADEDTVVNQRLVIGKQLDNEQLEKILFETEVGKLMDRIYGLLGKRARSEKEIRDYLRRKNLEFKVKKKEEVSTLVIESLINKLKQKGLINDFEFAKSWVLSRGKRRGKNLLKAELFKKGISKEIIDEVLEVETAKTQEVAAWQLLEKKLASWKNLDSRMQKQKAIAFLLRRGFEYDLVSGLVEKILKKGYNL